MHRRRLSLLPRLRRAASSDSGAAVLESTGMWALAVLVALAVATAMLSNTPVLGDVVQRAICLVTTLGQGSCGATHTSAAEHRPPQPCTVASNGHDTSASVSFIVTLKGGEKWQVDQLSDGTYRVTRGTSTGVGVGVGVGFDVTATVNDTTYGAAASAGAGAEATFGSGDVFYAKSQDEVDSLLVAHAQDVTEDVVVGNGPSRWVLDKAQGIIGQDRPLPTPEARYVEGGLSLTADAQATLLTASADAGAGVEAVLGYQIKGDGSTTEYFKATVDGHGQASILGGDSDDAGYQLVKAKAEGAVASTLAIDRDDSGAITAVRITSLLSGEALARSDTLENDDPQASGYVERTVELPVKSGSDQVIADNFLTAMGMPEIAGFNLPPSPVSTATGLPSLIPATAAFSQAARDRGYVTEQSFDHGTNSNGGTFDAEAIAKVGGSAEYNTNERAATGGQYWDGAQMVAWTGCG